MNFKELCTAAELSAADVSALREVQPALDEYLANRNFNSDPLSGAVVTHLIDAGKIAGHELGGSTLESYSSTLAAAVAKCEKALPRLNPLDVDDSDPFTNGSNKV